MDIMARRTRRHFSDDFKAQMVALHANGKSVYEISKEYDLTPSAVQRWVHQYENSGSFKAKDNKTPEELEMEKLRKENHQLKMENDILKQAALIMGRK